MNPIILLGAQHKALPHILAQGLLEESFKLGPVMPLSLPCQLVPVLNESMTCPQSQSQWDEQDRFLDSDIETFEPYPPNVTRPPSLRMLIFPFTHWGPCGTVLLTINGKAQEESSNCYPKPNLTPTWVTRVYL